MTAYIDNLLSSITMYRLLLYCLIFLLFAATVLSFLKLLPFNPVSILYSTVVITVVCGITNSIFAKIFKAPVNLESAYITALILALIIAPVGIFEGLKLLVLTGIAAMASKYILAIGKKHIFNPAAFAVVLTVIAFKFGASWWVGTFWMMPFVLITGLLIVRKVQKFSMVSVFILTYLLIILGQVILKGGGVFPTLQAVISETPLFFFAFVMLTEPQTTPPTRLMQIFYGSLVGLVYAVSPRIGSFYFTLEASLLAGNIFSYLVSPKDKLMLQLKDKIQIAPDIYNFVFNLSKKLAFLPGQYMEWTLDHKNPDSRGNRRYFTVASSPTEKNLQIGVKFYPNSSSFKKALLKIDPQKKIVASQLAGEFTLPKDKNKKLCFIAGGIGITPFRSMIKYLLDTNQKKDIILLYSNKLASDIVYQDIFDKAAKNLGIKTVYVLTEKEQAPSKWQGRTGYLNDKVITEEVPDYKDRIFYLSGPHSMVDAFVVALKEMGIPNSQIKVDFFPGYA